MELGTVICRAIVTTMDKRTRAISNDALSTMKALFSVILAVAFSIASLQAEPLHRAAHVAKSTAHTAKNVGHSVVKGTRRTTQTIVEPLPVP